MFPDSFSEYREPMVGGASVFMHARSKNLAEKYWINDQFEDLVAFWKTAQNPDLCRQLMDDLVDFKNRHQTLASIKSYFLNARDEEARDQYRRAFLFFLFNRITFSGTTRAGGFSAAASRSRFTLSSIERLKDMPCALAQTKITNFDYEALIEAKGSDVFIFLDPPYYHASRLYGRNGALHDFDHERLSALLAGTGHRFLITYDDCPEIRRLYRFANIRPWRLQYGMNNCNSENSSKIGSELFISNY